MGVSTTRTWWLLAALAMIAEASSGDWLVTRDGDRVETRGPWQVDGRRVVFTLPNGTLSALRLEDVDLEASEAATVDSQAPPAPAVAEETATEKRPSVMVLTNKDVKPASPPSAADGGEGGEAAEGESENGEADGDGEGASRVEVVTWRSVDSKQVDGLEIFGTVRNSSRETVGNVSLQVTINDDQGEPLFETAAFLRTRGLAPGKSTTFRALLPGIYALAVDPTFQISSEGITIQGRQRPPRAEDADDGAAGAGDRDRGRRGARERRRGATGPGEGGPGEPEN